MDTPRVQACKNKIFFPKNNVFFGKKSYYFILTNEKGIKQMIFNLLEA